MKKVRIECLKCGYVGQGNNIFLNRKELKSKIKNRMIICPNCDNKKKFKHWDVK